MNVEIERLAITLQNVPAALGDRVADRLEGVLKQALSMLKLHGAGNGLAQIDLGVVDAPAPADAQVISELIAARLVDWIVREHREQPPAGGTPKEGR